MGDLKPQPDDTHIYYNIAVANNNSSVGSSNSGTPYKAWNNTTIYPTNAEVSNILPAWNIGLTYLTGSYVYFTTIFNTQIYRAITNSIGVIPFANTTYWVQDNTTYIISTPYAFLSTSSITGGNPPFANPTNWIINNYPIPIPINNTETRLVFDERRTLPFLGKPSDYFLAVQRFTILTPNLPVFSCQPIVGQNNINKTIYSVTITGSSGTFTENIIYSPQDLSVPTPTAPVKSSDISNPYYYCYSYKYFMNLINNALTIAAGLAHAHNIFLDYDEVTHLFSLYGDVDYYRTSSTGTPLGAGGSDLVYFNTELYNLFASLPSINVTGTIGLGIDYQLLLSTGSDLAGTTQPYITNILTSNGINYVYANQEYITLPLWSPVKSIVFKCSIIYTVQELQGTPVIFEGGTNINSGKPNTEIEPIMVEHIVVQTIGTENKPLITYEPTGEYRCVDMYGDTPAYQIQFSVFWKDNYGNFIPFNLVVGMVSTLKILFRKKNFNISE